MSKIFRKVALERLSSPEQLDLLMQVTKPRSWLVFISITLLLVAGIVWSVTVKMPISVSAPVVLLDNANIATIYLSSEETADVVVGMPVDIVMMGTVSDAILTGYIASIDKTPTTANQIASQLIDPSLANLLTDQPISFAANIEIDDKADQLQAGMMGTATIKIGTHRPIDLVIPSQ